MTQSTTKIAKDNVSMEGGREGIQIKIIDHLLCLDPFEPSSNTH